MRVIDLFAGCGGMSLGFENAGFDIIAAFDNWDAAIKIYESNFSHPIYKKDLSKDDIIQQLSDMRPDVIMGGPPCQDYSIAGCLLYTSPSPRDGLLSRMPSSA